jgi:hypothetical protein
MGGSYKRESGWGAWTKMATWQDLGVGDFFGWTLRGVADC